MLRRFSCQLKSTKQFFKPQNLSVITWQHRCSHLERTKYSVSKPKSKEKIYTWEFPKLEPAWANIPKEEQWKVIWPELTEWELNRPSQHIVLDAIDLHKEIWKDALWEYLQMRYPGRFKNKQHLKKVLKELKRKRLVFTLPHPTERNHQYLYRCNPHGWYIRHKREKEKEEQQKLAQQQQQEKSQQETSQ